MSLWQDKETKKRKVSTTTIVNDQDRATLAQNYTFLPQAQQQHKSWQGRMVLQYHSHLYRDVVLANMTRVEKRQLGLRWRTAAEVQSGRGTETCGNLHCPSWTNPITTNECTHHQIDGDTNETIFANTNRQAEEAERTRIGKFPYGASCTDFEVPFTYTEQSESKTELVKLRLCVRCAPLLFQSKGEKYPYLVARRSRRDTCERKDKNSSDDDSGAEAANQERGSPHDPVFPKKTKYSDDNDEKNGGKSGER